MSTELDTPFTVISPKTGEALTLDSPTEDLAEWLSAIREYEAEIQAAKRVVSAELLSRLDQRAKWTQHFPERRISISSESPKPTEEWDGAELREFLLELVDEGVISIEAVDAAVEQQITYKVKKAGINSLRSLGGRAKEVVDALASEKDKSRSVTVTTR